MAKSASVDVQKSNWEGSIPIAISLASTSLSSPTIPPSLHRIISRQSYLHIALEDEVRMFHEFAPVTCFRSVTQKDVTSNENGEENDKGDNAIDEAKDKQQGNASNLNDEMAKKEAVSDGKTPYPVCWFEDEETGLPLRWHIFVGVLHDMFCIKQQEPSMHRLPWKIRIHFTSYPATLLPVISSHQKSKDTDVIRCIFQYYLNSLKQSLYVQYNSGKVAKNMTKQSHLQLWDGIVRNQYEVYRSIASDLDGNITVGGNSNAEISCTCSSIPLRILVDARPAFSRPCRLDAKDSEEIITLGNVLQECLPDLFPTAGDSGILAEENSVGKTPRYLIQGIHVPLESHILDIWKSLSHPDRFLYIAVSTH
uniref:Autophagy protein 5 n=1 Tax=Chaetoceros debilis TaxID=122233 RepID=A0A7S3V9I3_9STRA